MKIILTEADVKELVFKALADKNMLDMNDLNDFEYTLTIESYSENYMTVEKVMTKVEEK